MKVEEWKEALKKLEAILVDAMDTHDKSLKDIEELQFTIANYKSKIQTFK